MIRPGGEPDSGVALLGDCFYPPPHHLRREGDTTDFGMGRELLAERHDWYVDALGAAQSGLHGSAGRDLTELAGGATSSLGAR